MRFFVSISGLLLLAFVAISPAAAVTVETPQFTVVLPGANWEHLPLKKGATPWRYTRRFSDSHTLFSAITWIPLDEEDEPAASEDQVVQDIIVEARRQAELPGRRLLDWKRDDESGVAEGQGCWRYGADFQVAVNEGVWVDYRSRGFICHVPDGDGLAWLRYDELKDTEENWEPGFEEAAVNFRESLQPAE